MKTPSLLLALALLLPAAARAQDAAAPVTLASPEVFHAVSQFYAYDRAAPLDAQVVARQETPTYVREKVVFSGVDGLRVPGYLAIPKTRAGRVPLVLLIDGVMGSKERWFQEDSWPRGTLVTQGLIDAGIAVLALDARYHGERAAENGYRTPRFSAEPADREMISRSVVEYRRALDYLVTRPEIDTARIGSLGLSMGGVMTFALSALDPRIRAAVAGVTPITTMKAPLAIPISPMTFAGAIRTTPFLMLMGRTDGYYTPAEAERLHALLPTPRKELVLYDSGHRLPPEYAARSVEWLRAHLK